MKSNKVFLIAAIAGLFVTPCLAGNGSGGGGYASTCRNPQGKIERAELLDLYEARTVYHRTLLTSSGDSLEDYKAALKNMYTLQGYPEAYEVEIAEKSFRNFFDITEFTKPGEKVPEIKDLGEIPPPAGCQYEQVAAFGGKEKFLTLKWGKIDSEIWNALDSQNQAALIVHESHYSGYRYLEEKTSQNARIAVGIIFSEGIVPVKANLPLERQSCEAKDGEIEVANRRLTSAFYAFPFQNSDGTQGLQIQFTHLMGRPIFSKTTAFFSGLKMLKLEEGPARPPFVSDPKANSVRIASVFGEQTAGWQVELTYIYQKPAFLTAIVNGQRQAPVPIWRCFHEGVIR